MIPSPAARPPRCLRLRSPLAAALLGWFLPGLGQVYAGRSAKGALYLLAILPTFAIGWLLTDGTIVDPAAYRLDFVAQVFLGGPVGAILKWGPDPELLRIPRFFDVGRLYVQVAGLLNLVAICDAVGTVIQGNRIALVQAPTAPSTPLPEPVIEAPPAVRHDPEAGDFALPPEPPTAPPAPLASPLPPLRPREDDA